MATDQQATAHPVSEQERKLKQQILELIRVAYEVKNSKKTWCKTLERLATATASLTMMGSLVTNLAYPRDKRTSLIRTVIYSKRKSETVWEQLQKALPADKRPQASQLRVALEEYVKSVAHVFETVVK